MAPEYFMISTILETKNKRKKRHVNSMKTFSLYQKLTWLSIETSTILNRSNLLKSEMNQRYILNQLHWNYSYIYFTEPCKSTISTHRKIIKIDSYSTMYKFYHFFFY